MCTGLPFDTSVGTKIETQKKTGRCQAAGQVEVVCSAAHKRVLRRNPRAAKVLRRGTFPRTEARARLSRAPPVAPVGGCLKPAPINSGV